MPQSPLVGQLIRLLSLAIGLMAMPPALAMEPVDSARQALWRMAVAADTLSYRGVAIHEQAGALTSVRIVRAVRDGQQWERLEYLDGHPQEVIRRSYDRRCSGAPELPSRSADPADPDLGALAHYRISFREDDRVAGRRIRQLQLQPRDAFRYGHMLGLDRATGLLLRKLVFDGDGSLVERFQFTAIDIGAVIDEAELEPRFGQHVVVATPPCSDRHGSEDPTPWQITWVPPGFERSGPPRVSADGVRQVHYSDGFSSFSVFIDRAAGFGAQVEARRGPTVAYMAPETGGEGHTICVVGELPVLTARQIAAGVRPGNAQSLPAAAAVQ